MGGVARAVFMHGNRQLKLNNYIAISGLCNIIGDKVTVEVFHSSPYDEMFRDNCIANYVVNCRGEFFHALQVILCKAKK